MTCRNCGGPFPHPGGQLTCPAKGASCKLCGKPNHFAHCCFSRPRMERDNKRYTKPRQRQDISQELLSKYPNITNGIGKLKNVQVRLLIDDTVKPVAQPHHRINFHVRKKVEKELQLLEDEGIIEKVEGPTPWVSPIVAMPKPKNPEKIRICEDMRLPNQAVLRVRHISPTVDDIIHDLNGAVMFSKLDLNSGYHQLELAPESRYNTTCSRHVGLRRYTRLIFGISSAAEVFQNTIQQDIPGVRNFSDDILVYGTTADAHIRSLEAVFQRLHENNLTINKGKCDFHKTSLEFFGYLFSNKGIAPDPPKIEAITDMPPPLNQSEMRSLLATSTAFAEGKPWKQELYKFLRNYRATPHQTTGISPAELLFGRPMHIKLPTVHSPVHDDALRQADCHKKEKMKQYSDKRKRVSTSELTTGDCILIREKTKGKLKTPYNPKPYKVIKTKGTMITAQRGQHIITRNTSHFKPLKQRVHVPLCDLSDDEMDEFDYGDRPQEQRRPPNVPENPEQRERRYPRRENRKRPQKLMDYT
ncbi:uncharacterized protein K02A2.6-like [Tachysurus ichikawai]